MKEGKLDGKANWVKLIDFQVNPRWIGSWLQAGKVSSSAAEKELLGCRIGALHIIKELRAMDSEHKKILQQELQRTWAAELSKYRVFT